VKYAGFSLIECMIYCMVLAILFMTWFHGMVVAHTAFVKKATKTIQLSNVYAAHDMLIRDIRHAPSKSTQWKLCTNTQLIWHQQENDIGWMIHNNTLFRIEGTYDAERQKWCKKKQSVALFDVARISFTKHSMLEYIKSIKCKLVLLNNETIDMQVALRNGVVNG